MRDGIWKDKYLVDIKHLDGTNKITFDSVSGLTIGAGVCMNRVMALPDVQSHYPLLAEACRWVASYQLRSRATVVGNICNASPAGDTIGACLAYDGEVLVHGVDGQRKEALADFFLGPGKTVLNPGDIVTAVHLPLPPAGSVGKYIKLGRNNWGDLAIVGVTVLGYPGKVPSGYHFRIALASVAPTPLVVADAQAYLATNTITPEALKIAARMTMDACNPIDDVRGSARYRKAMVERLTLKALLSVWNSLMN
jgi:carbon-monoxide dehydrogenase medium subunit